MKIFKSVKNVGTQESTVCGRDFTQIALLNPISVEAEKDSQLLITLTVPDTWCDVAGEGAWFAIKAGSPGTNNIVARGLYTCGIAGQRVPIVLQALVDITCDQPVEVVAQWHATGNAPCYIGSASETVLTVLVNDEQWQKKTLQSQVDKYLKAQSKTSGWPFS